MVLYPLPSGRRGPRDAAPIPAWQAVEQKQEQVAQDWWLIAQNDHAVLAGDLAARLDFPATPSLSAEVVRAISCHDAGWTQFDTHAWAITVPQRRPPLSFLDISPMEFLIAWVGSIDAAEHVGAVGGIIVSAHFCRLARNRLASRNDVPEDVSRLDQFLADEACRQRRLRNQVRESASELETLTDVLQFCDLVSLYLCCGADERAEFPQQFDGIAVQVRSDGDAFLFTPPVFGRGTALGVSARRYPGKQVGTLPFLLG